MRLGSAHSCSIFSSRPLVPLQGVSCTNPNCFLQPTRRLFHQLTDIDTDTDTDTHSQTHTHTHTHTRTNLFPAVKADLANFHVTRLFQIRPGSEHNLHILLLAPCSGSGCAHARVCHVNNAAACAFSQRNALNHMHRAGRVGHTFDAVLLDKLAALLNQLLR